MISKYFKEKKISFTEFLIGLLGVLGISLGILGGYIYSISIKSENNTEIFATIAMVSASAYVFGNLIGFLFGIPRTNEKNLNSDTYDNSKESKNNINYRVNTNLEQVSDWLTKIIVGVGLVELSEIKSNVLSISAKIASDIKWQHAESMIIATIIYFLILGFFVVYYATRLWLTGELVKADLKLYDIPKKNNISILPEKLEHNQKEILKNIIQSHESKENYLIKEDLKKNPTLYSTLNLLVTGNIINPCLEGDWEVGKTVNLTPIAIKLLPFIKNEFS